VRRSPGTGSVYQPRYRSASGELRKSRLYWIAYRVAGALKREPTKTANRQAAETLLRTRLSALDRGETPAAGTAKWEDLAEFIRADYLANGRRSTHRLELSLRHLEKSFDGQRAAAITAERISAFVARRLTEDGAARATINLDLATLGRAFRLAYRAGRVAFVPFVQKLKTSNARTGFFERPEFGRLVRALPRDLRPCAIAAYLTGWRMTSELLTRQWRHVDMGARWLRLEPGEGKTGEGRQFPLFPELALVLRAQRRLTTAEERRLGRFIPWVFHHDGEPLFYRAKKRSSALLPSGYLRAAWLAACVSAGVSGRIRHDFRRTAARDMLRAGVSVPTVMRAIGWRSEAMLRRYAIVSDGDLQEAGAKRARLPR
jgi:integrase